MVAPLHLVAGISRVHLPPGGRLLAQLEPWRQAFNAEFGAADVQLHAAGSGWVLEAPFAHAASDPAPEVLAGRPLVRQPASDADLRALRRLGAEVELWLAAHPLNREREQRQLPPLNTFWFWGGARAGALPAAMATPGVIASPWPPDAWLTGLALHTRSRLAEAAGWSSLPEGATLIALVPPADIAPGHYWADIESRWLAPALQALERGQIRALRLQLGGSAWQLPHRSPLRWLRRARPWFRLVQA